MEVIHRELCRFVVRFIRSSQVLRVPVVVSHERVDDEPGVLVRPSAAPAALLHRQDPAKRVPEVRVEDGVDDRVEGGVGVAEPGQDLEGERRDAFLANAVDHVHDEEGSPEREVVLVALV